MQIEIIFLAIWGFFILVAKFLPKKTQPHIKTEAIKKIRKKYRSFELLSTLGFFVLAPLIAYFLTVGMVSIQTIILNENDPGTRYVIGIDRWYFMIPSLFMAMLIYGIALDYIGILIRKYIFKNENEYNIFYFDWNKKLAFGNNIDNERLTLIFTIFVVPLFLIMFYLGVNNYAKIIDTQLIANDFFSLQEKHFNYDDVGKILYISNFKNKISGKIEHTSPHYLVIMKNGYKWSTLNLSIHNSPKETEVINFISQKTKIPIQEAIHNIDDR